MPRTLRGRRDPAPGPGPAPAAGTGEATSWATSPPSLTLRSWERPASVSLSAPSHPSFGAGSSASGTHTCRVCSVGPVSAHRAGWGTPGSQRQVAPAAPRRQTGKCCSERTSLHNPPRGAPSASRVTRAPKAPVRGLLDPGIWPRALSGSETGTMANSLAPQAPRAPAPPLCPPRSPHALPLCLTVPTAATTCHTATAMVALTAPCSCRRGDLLLARSRHLGAQGGHQGWWRGSQAATPQPEQALPGSVIPRLQSPEARGTKAGPAVRQ